MKYSLLFLLSLVTLLLGNSAIARANDAKPEQFRLDQPALKTLSYYPKSVPSQISSDPSKLQAAESDANLVSATMPSEATTGSELPPLTAPQKPTALTFNPVALVQSSEPPETSSHAAPPTNATATSDSIRQTTAIAIPSTSSPASSPAIPTVATDPTLDPLFVGDADSLVAKAVGSAEGTRTPAGDRTSAYRGHTDPGNKVWNLGSFSYQHQASSPEDADRRQIKRLRYQASVMQEKAAAYNIQLNLEEILNGIDLANQAPKALLDRNGYIDWLARAHRLGKRDADAILWARTYAFRNPNTSLWDAPGLGNTKESIMRDQQRRMLAVAEAIAHSQGETQKSMERSTGEPTGKPKVVANLELSDRSEPQGIAQTVAKQVKALFRIVN